MSRSKSIKILQSALGSYSLDLIAAIAPRVFFITQYPKFVEDFREEFGFNSENMPA